MVQSENLRYCQASHISGPYHHDQGAGSPIFDAELLLTPNANKYNSITFRLISAVYRLALFGAGVAHKQVFQLCLCTVKFP